MSPEQIQAVRASWKQVVPIREQAADLFYGRLFEIAPDVKGLFKGDMKAQGARLMTMIDTAVGSLDNLPRIVPAVQALGRRHAGYGVKDQHYDTVAVALLWTLEKGLGPAFTADVREAWTAAYGVLASTMKSATA